MSDVLASLRTDQVVGLSDNMDGVYTLLATPRVIHTKNTTHVGSCLLDRTKISPGVLADLNTYLTRQTVYTRDLSRQEAIQIIAQNRARLAPPSFTTGYVASEKGDLLSNRFFASEAHNPLLPTWTISARLEADYTHLAALVRANAADHNTVLYLEQCAHDLHADMRACTSDTYARLIAVIMGRALPWSQQECVYAVYISVYMPLARVVSSYHPARPLAIRRAQDNTQCTPSYTEQLQLLGLN